jgi:hypothetical protein
MSPSSNFFRAARPAFRARQFFFRPKQGGGGARFQSTAAGGEAAADSWAKRMWNSPVGLKTVHFWYAPLQPSSPPTSGTSKCYRSEVLITCACV